MTMLVVASRKSTRQKEIVQGRSGQGGCLPFQDFLRTRQHVSLSLSLSVRVVRANKHARGRGLYFFFEMATGIIAGQAVRRSAHDPPSKMTARFSYRGTTGLRLLSAPQRLHRPLLLQLFILIKFIACNSSIGKKSQTWKQQNNVASYFLSFRQWP